MGSVVLHDVPSYSIVAGVPAKVIRYRFDDSTISKLQQIEWWDRSVIWIKNKAPDFISVDKFIDNIK